jgi:hypothetical protein
MDDYELVKEESRDVLTVVVIENSVSCGTPCSAVKVDGRFGGTYNSISMVEKCAKKDSILLISTLWFLAWFTLRP